MRYISKKSYIRLAEMNGTVADSKEVREGLMAKVYSGEMTLQEAQKKLIDIKENAKKNGMHTRSEIYENW